MKFVLDTNVFYSYTDITDGLKINTKIKNDNAEFSSFLIDYKDQFYISSVTVYEFLTKFMKEPQRIKKYLHFVEEKKLRIINKDYFPFFEADLQKIKVMNDATLQEYIETSILPIKVKIESRFLAFYVYEISLMFLNNHCKDPDYHLDQARIYAITMVLKKNLSSIQRTICEQLKSGYLIGVPKGAAKETFYQQLCSIIVQTDKFLKSSDEDLRKGNISFEMTVNKKFTGDDREKVYDFFSREVRRHRKDDNLMRNYLRSESQKRGLSQVQIDFMDWIIQQIGEKKGRSFQKNDIDDMLIANVLNDPENILVTWDGNFISFLTTHNLPSYNTISQIYDVKNSS
jgi:predicted nucleic acid-binding protein